jgi:hypothetical protein
LSAADGVERAVAAEAFADGDGIYARPVAGNVHPRDAICDKATAFIVEQAAGGDAVDGGAEE